jgi:hypothetical protein
VARLRGFFEFNSAHRVYAHYSRICAYRATLVSFGGALSLSDAKTTTNRKPAKSGALHTPNKHNLQCLPPPYEWPHGGAGP